MSSLPDVGGHGVCAERGERGFKSTRVQIPQMRNTVKGMQVIQQEGCEAVLILLTFVLY